MTRTKRLPRTLTADEARRLVAQPSLRHPTGLRNRCMLRLMLETGLRAGEVVALRLEHLDLRTCQLDVREGKGAKDRTLWVRDDLRDCIARWLEVRPDSAWLFPTQSGRRLDTRYLRAMVKRCAVRAGVREPDRVSPHALRHTFATELFRATKDIRLTQKALGHSDVSTTMIYTHVVDEELMGALRGAHRVAGPVGARATLQAAESGCDR